MGLRRRKIVERREVDQKFPHQNGVPPKIPNIKIEGCRWQRFTIKNVGGSMATNFAFRTDSIV